MRFLNWLLVFSLVFAALSGFAAYAQTTTAAASRTEDEDLRRTVRELALRVSALEEELHRQRTGTAIESASLKPAVLVEPKVDEVLSPNQPTLTVGKVWWYGGKQGAW
jgi:hypothetical protein